ncbi:nucleoside triphosphate pyrophosphohydrolase [Sphingomonas sp. GCM10030256]|uniref:nucleoside triphosphate pyrophosphohydrolase n=1 Tax=Sphingomonas sp. GCM10030256 TaxID=3273427 RepID=UPI003613E792
MSDADPARPARAEAPQELDASLHRLAKIMKQLRDPVHGCEWDRVQTFATIAPYTIEEAYEVADAIARNDLADLQEELGDLQLQVVFHAQIAADAGHFGLDDVIAGICDKLERRHPHIFGDAPSGGHHLWEQIKAEERAGKTKDSSALSGVALALPALERAAKLQQRAARTGFDWPDPRGPRAKIDEELRELDAEVEPAPRMEELGDLLFAVVNLARHLNIDAEEALRQANRKFERRFRTIESERGFAALTLEEKERLWGRAKRAQSD